MIGKFIVYEGVFRNRWVARKVTGQTEKTITVERCAPVDGDYDTANRKKTASLGKHGIFDTPEEAEQTAKAMTEQLLRMAEDYRAAKASVIETYIGEKTQ